MSPSDRARLGWWLSGGATVSWLVAVVIAGQVGRVVDNWEAALTMLFGSFLAGSSPEGGGAVAFPVFTKALEVPGPVARTFGLSIQAVGMTMASISILLSGRRLHRRAAVVGSAVAIVGFAVGAGAFGRPDEVFWPSVVGSAWVKATFSIVLATTSILMVRHLRQQRTVGHDAFGELGSAWTGRYDMALVVVALLGGFLSSLTGTGANIVVFLFLVVLVGVGPKAALPTAILVMTSVSIVGFVLFGLVDGQLDVALVGDRVTAVGGQEVPEALAEGRSDLLGLWLAAVPVVVWGAPLGSLVASLVEERHLVRFVALLAAVEVATTVVLVPELRTEPALILYLAVGLAGLPAAFIYGQRHRRRVFGASVPTASVAAANVGGHSH